MMIQVKWWDGKGDHDDPKTGTAGVTNTALYHWLLGKRVTGVGGVDTGTDTVNINISDGTIIWFTVTNDVPRILIQKP